MPTAHRAAQRRQLDTVAATSVNWQNFKNLEKEDQVIAWQMCLMQETLIAIIEFALTRMGEIYSLVRTINLDDGPPEPHTGGENSSLMGTMQRK